MSTVDVNCPSCGVPVSLRCAKTPTTSPTLRAIALAAKEKALTREQMLEGGLRRRKKSGKDDATGGPLLTPRGGGGGVEEGGVWWRVQGDGGA